VCSAVLFAGYKIFYMRDYQKARKADEEYAKIC